MAFRDFFRGDRDRDEDERNRERWRSMGGEWRDEDRGRRGESWERGERDYGQGYGAERGWSPGSEYYSDRAQSYRGDYDEGERSAQRWGERGGRTEREREDYGGRYGHTGGMSRWGEDDQRSGAGYSGRGSGSDVYSRYYGGGASGYTGSGYGESYSSGAGRSYGEGGYGRDLDQGRRGAMGYGGYGGMGGAETGSGALSSWQNQSGQGQERSQQWGEQQHRGKGPRGYKRSDQRIHEEVCDCLTDDPRVDASNLEVTVKDCEVTLSGTVNSREEKRRAEDLIERIPGVKDVTNNLRVQQQAQTAGSENMASPSARH